MDLLAEISFDFLDRGSDSEVGKFSPSFPSSFGGSKFVVKGVGFGDREVSLGE